MDIDKPVLIAKCKRNYGKVPFTCAEALKLQGWQITGKIRGGWTYIYGIPPKQIQHELGMDKE